MPMDLKVSVDLSGVLQARPVVDAQILPLLHQAVGAVAQATNNQWKEAVFRAPLWEGERDAYVQSISWRWTGDFSAEVEATYRYAEEIETGRPERDLKRMLDSSTKVRMSKQGKRYLIIPFRHNIPGAEARGRPMADHVYEQAKMLTASRITGQTKRPSGTGAFDRQTRQRLTVNQNLYKWGDRLPAGLVRKLRSHHKTDPAAGMVRFSAPSGRSTNYSTYMTFRVMHEDSTGWIVQARPGLNIAKGVVEQIQPKAEAAFGEAIKRELGT